jgi:hypothetical protein
VEVGGEILEGAMYELDSERPVLWEAPEQEAEPEPARLQAYELRVGEDHVELRRELAVDHLDELVEGLGQGAARKAPQEVDELGRTAPRCRCKYLDQRSGLAHVWPTTPGVMVRSVLLPVVSSLSTVHGRAGRQSSPQLNAPRGVARRCCTQPGGFVLRTAWMDDAWTERGPNEGVVWRAKRYADYAGGLQVVHELVVDPGNPALRIAAHRDWTVASGGHRGGPRLVAGGTALTSNADCAAEDTSSAGFIAASPRTIAGIRGDGRISLVAVTVVVSDGELATEQSFDNMNCTSRVPLRPCGARERRSGFRGRRHARGIPYDAPIMSSDEAFDLSTHPVHLGLGARAVRAPAFEGPGVLRGP